MKKNTIFNRISIKLGLLFSGVFLILLLILGTILYGVFTNLFVDFVSSDLLVRGNNHAKALEADYTPDTINHIISMEKGGPATVVITDKKQKILGASAPIDNEMKNLLLQKNESPPGKMAASDWKKDKYIVTISVIGNNNGFIYMYYPADILRETVSVLKMLILITSLGTVFLAFGLIGFLSRKITQPLLSMKDATNRLAKGEYKQLIHVKGKDEIGQLAQSIQQLGEQLQYFEDTRNEFLSAVSHELRTPLTYIKGYSDILSKGIIKNKEEQAEYLAIINRETNRLSFLVNDLFEMSKLEVGKFQLNKESGNINTIIEKSASSLKPIAEKKGITFRLILSEEIPEIPIDIQRIEQVVYNLIENAVKYSDSGEVVLRTFIKNKTAVIEIADRGIGIPQQELSKIWERFYRIEKSRARKTGGTGLGLYIAKQIIESHHGEIKVQSIENQGSTFSIFLPVEVKR